MKHFQIFLQSLRKCITIMGLFKTGICLNFPLSEAFQILLYLDVSVLKLNMISVFFVETSAEPTHYLDFMNFPGGDDSYGVHYNSGIINHWYYLLINGGQVCTPFLN